jgi:diketogulonate reductase-like aldo/keto reductase
MKQYIELHNGVKMPLMAIGTNWMSYKELYPIVRAGLQAGFRAIDTARDYGNEDVVGAVVKDVLLDLGMKREDILITTKIGNSQQIKGNIEDEINISLKNLQTDYVDLWLMHWPYPDYYMNTWRKMIDVYEKTNKVRAIGVANYQLRHFEKLLSSNPNVIPMVNQMEYHPLRTVNKLKEYMDTYGIVLQAYAPLCRLIPPLRESGILKSLALKYNKSLAQIILRWHIQQKNVMPIFKSYKTSRFSENIDIFDFNLTDKEIAAISDLDINYKYHLESSSCPGY